MSKESRNIALFV